MTGSTKKFRTNVKSRPSVQTVFQSQVTEEEFNTTQEFNQCDEEPNDNLPTTSKEQAEISNESISHRRPSLSVLRNTLHSANLANTDSVLDGHSVSMTTDSDFDAFDLVDFSSRQQIETPESSGHVGIVIREIRRSSVPPELPSTFELKENISVASVETQPEFHRDWQVVSEVHGFWHHLESLSRIVTSILRQIPNPRTLYQNYRAYPSPPASSARPAPPPAPPTRPALSATRTTPQIADVLMEAIMILQEAELTGTNLDVVKE